MKREHKVWGERWLIREDSTHAVSFLKLKAGYRCSWHMHQTKHNLFVVISGDVGIVTEEMGERRELVLCGGQTFTVPPGRWHEFRAYDDSMIIEEMFVEYSETDILRQEVGGKFVCG